MALASPEIAERKIHGRPFGTADPADWSPPAIAIASIALAFLELDPTVVWDTERIAHIRATFESEAMGAV